jgi:membrane fusion protein (multidrug efflux system)
VNTLSSSRHWLARRGGQFVLLGTCLLIAPSVDAEESKATIVRAVKIERHAVDMKFQYAARISAFREVQVRARVGGILLKRNFVEGAEVKAGDVLFILDPAPYRAALAQADAQLMQAQAELNQARREEARSVALFDRNVSSQKTRDEAVSTRELAEASLAAATAAVQTAQLNVDYTSVEAPISGITSLEHVSEGSLIGTGETSLLTSIVQVDPAYVNFSFSDEEISEVRQMLAGNKSNGQDSKLRVDISFGDGTHYDRQAAVDFTSSSIDMETGTLQARAVIENPERRLLPGQFVRATLVGASSDALVIPDTALMQGPKGEFVYTIDGDGKAVVSPVTLGRKVNEDWIVTSGLKEGDEVIMDGLIKVKPGQPVAVDGREKVAASQ